MKTKLSFIGTYFISLLLIAVGMFVLCSCDQLAPQLAKTTEQSDSVLFAQYIDRIVNPEFSSTSEILQFRQCKIKNAQIDSVFMSMDDETIRNVASVCLKRGSPITRKDLIDEYQKNSDIYQALPRSIEIAGKKDTAPEEPRVTQVGMPSETTISVNLKDTIIEGKKYRIETKLVEYNE